MNIPKIEEAITLLYQTYIENQDVATQRGIAITAMNEMVNLLGGDDVVKKIEAVPYSARLRAQHLFEDGPILAKQEQHTLSSRVNDVRVHIEHGKQHDEAMKRITAKQEQGEPVGYTDEHGNAYQYGYTGPKFAPNIQLYTTPQPAQKPWVGLMRGVRVEGDTVVISVHYGNDAARQLCADLIKEMNT